jgi:hydroxypyruvate reductase
VKVTEAKPGRGGRSTQQAVLLAHTLPGDVAFLAAASDGVDGPSGLAGAIVDADFAEAVSEMRCNEALDHFDTACLPESAGTSIPAGPTGLNLADLHLLARAKK